MKYKILLLFLVININAKTQPAYIYFEDGLKKMDARDYTAAAISFGIAISKDAKHYKSFAERSNANFLQKNYATIMADIDQAIKLNDKYTAAHIYKAKFLVDAKKYDLAIKSAQKAVLQDAQLAEPYFILAQSAQALNDLELAKNNYEKATSLNINNPNAFINIAKIYQEQKNYDLSIAAAEKGITKFPTNYELQYILADDYFNKTEFTKALNIIKACIDNKYNLAQSVLLRAKTNTKLKNNDQAIADYNALITTYKINTNEVYTQRGLAYKNKKDYANAIKDFTKAISKDFSNTILYEYRALCYLNLNKKPQALVDYNKILSFDDKNENALFNRATIFFEQNKFDKAIEDYSKLINNKPSADVYYNRSKCYYKINKQKECCNDLQQAINLGDKQAQKDKDSVCKY